MSFLGGKLKYIYQTHNHVSEKQNLFAGHANFSCKTRYNDIYEGQNDSKIFTPFRHVFFYISSVFIF